MNRTEQEKLFRRGLSLCRKGQLSDAADAMQTLLNSGSEEPLHLSYAGLLTATVRGDRRAGMQLCERALSFGADEPDVVINLARVYVSVGARVKAVKVLRHGLGKTPDHPGMLTFIDKLSPRAKPPLSMVDRNNPINKSMAIALAKMRGRLDREKEVSAIQTA